LTTVYLAAIAFGVTLLLASLVLGGKDVGHGHGHGDTGEGIAWAPIGSLRFWIFLFAFGGTAGYLLTQLHSSAIVAGIGAAVIGWISGLLAVVVVRAVSKGSVSSGVEGKELIGQTGTLLLPAGKDRPGKLRIQLGSKTEDFVVTLVDDGDDLPTGTPVLVVAEGERGSLLVAKAEM
jgi:hypothetical protein